MIIHILENGPPIALMEDTGSKVMQIWEEAYRVLMKNGQDALEFIWKNAPNLYIKDLEDPDAKHQDPDSALYWAMRLGDVALVRILLRNGAKHVEESKSWRKAMIMAAKDQELEKVRATLAKQKNPHDRTQVLQLAVLGGHEDMVRQLLEKGADVNRLWEFDESRYTLLEHLVIGHCRARWPIPWTERSERMLRLLLAYGADPTIPDEDQKSALSYAQECSHEGILEAFSDPYPWNGVGPRPRGELKLVGVEKEKGFFENWIIWRFVRQTHIAAKNGYKKAGKSLTSFFQGKR